MYGENKYYDLIFKVNLEHGLLTRASKYLLEYAEALLYSDAHRQI